MGFFISDFPRITLSSYTFHTSFKNYLCCALKANWDTEKVKKILWKKAKDIVKTTTKMILTELFTSGNLVWGKINFYETFSQFLGNKNKLHRK